MNNVFPESFDRINIQNTEEALGKIENYIHYICERTDFAIQNLAKTSGGNELTDESLVAMVKDLQSKASSASSQIAGINASVNDIANSTRELPGQFHTLEINLQLVQETLDSIKTDVDLGSLTIRLSEVLEHVADLQLTIEAEQRELDEIKGFPVTFDNGTPYSGHFSNNAVDIDVRKNGSIINALKIGEDTTEAENFHATKSIKVGEWRLAESSLGFAIKYEG